MTLAPVRLGLRANAGQFALLVALNAFVGAMVGLERSVLPIVGENDFGLSSKSAILAFVVAFGIAKALANLAAGGFAYTTHLTDSDPRMFADIARTNRDNIVRRLNLYIQELIDLRDAIDDDRPEVKERFERARTLHLDWLSGRAQGQASDESSNMPSTRSMLTGSLFGRLGGGGSKDKDT